MSTLLTVKQVKSLTIGFTLPETYDMSRVEEIKVYLGKNVYPHTIDERVVKCQIKSDDTAVMYGVNRLSFWLDDSIIGVYPVYCGDIVFEYTNAIEHNESVNTLFDVMVNLTISETAITVDSVLYNILKGDKGDPFLYSDFTPEQVEALKVKGDKGDSFEYEDFTPEQITVLQQPATDIASTVSQSEGLRVTAESGRVTAEGLRVTAESNRSAAESLRAGAESDRSAAELLRAGAESIREGNEDDREQSEALRVQAEIDREINTGTAIQNAETATQNASDAAILANNKAGLADTAAINANTKAGLADTAATNANTKAGLANTAATNANNVANGYAAELALKELKANKQNSLTTDGTGTKFPTVDAVNAGLAGNTNLLSTYVHSGNKEVYVTSIDYATNTFFKTNHGLVNGDIIAVKILDYNAIEAILPIKNNTSGAVSGYRVVNASANTFQISLTEGGAAIVLVNKAGIDLTKWRFEVVPTIMDLTFTNVNNGNCTIEIYGDLSRVPRYAAGGIYTGYSSSQTSLTAIPHDIGNVFMCLYTITYRNNNGIITVNRKWNGIQLNSADTTKITFISGELFQIPKRDSYSNINTIGLQSAHITNGTIIKVYKL